MAKANLETAKSKSESIRQQGNDLCIQTSESILSAVEDDIKRLKNSHILTIKIEEKKLLNQICQQLRSDAFKKSIELLKKRFNSKFHKKLVSKNIEKLSKKNLRIN